MKKRKTESSERHKSHKRHDYVREISEKHERDSNIEPSTVKKQKKSKSKRHTSKDV